MLTLNPEPNKIYAVNFWHDTTWKILSLEEFNSTYKERIKIYGNAAFSGYEIVVSTDRLSVKYCPLLRSINGSFIADYGNTYDYTFDSLVNYDGTNAKLLGKEIQEYIRGK